MSWWCLEEGQRICFLVSDWCRLEAGSSLWPWEEAASETAELQDAAWKGNVLCHGCQCAWVIIMTSLRSDISLPGQWLPCTVTRSWQSFPVTSEPPHSEWEENTVFLLAVGAIPHPDSNRGDAAGHAGLGLDRWCWFISCCQQEPDQKEDV